MLFSRLIRTIGDVIGDINFVSGGVGVEFSAAAAAFHAKCLLCDKPVTTGALHRARTAKPGSAAGGGLSRSASSNIAPLPILSSTSKPSSGYYYDKADDPDLRPRSSGTALGSDTGQSMFVKGPEKAKVLTELAVIRSSIEALPEITVIYIISFVTIAL